MIVRSFVSYFFLSIPAGAYKLGNFRMASIAETFPVTIGVGSLSQASDITLCTNDAFMADTFFKKPEFFLRFTLEDVEAMIKADDSVFLVAQSGENLVGSLYLHWEDTSSEINGKFSAVSVPSKYGRRGIGKALVDAAEKHLLSLAAATDAKQSVNIQMGVINLREDLFAWYKSQGFEIVDKLPNDPELLRIIRDDLLDQVWCVLMKKQLR